MSSITQTTKYRNRVCEYALKHSKMEAHIKYNISRPTIDNWLGKYDGTRESLLDKSRKPKTNPKTCTQEEVELVIKIWKEHGWAGGDYVFGILLREHGFKRKQGVMYKIARKHKLIKKKEKKKRENKPYHTAKYPGEKAQMDVKYVPQDALPREFEGEKWYQYTIIDEATGIRYLEWFKERNRFNTCKFVFNAMKFYKFKLHQIQTDNGSEFVNETVAEMLETIGINHKRIRPYTPRHNGKVERSHRVDDKFFYEGFIAKDFEDLQKQGKAWNEAYNNMYMKKFNWLSPNEVYEIWKKNIKKPIKKQNLSVDKLKVA